MNYRVDAHEAERHFLRASFTGIETLFHLCPAHQLRPPSGLGSDNGAAEHD